MRLTTTFRVALHASATIAHRIPVHQHNGRAESDVPMTSYDPNSMEPRYSYDPTSTCPLPTTIFSTVMETRADFTTVTVTIPAASTTGNVTIASSAPKQHPTGVDSTTSATITVTSCSMGPSTSTPPTSTGSMVSATSEPYTSTLATTQSGPCAAVSPPTTTKSGTVKGCNEWYVARPGDTCQKIAEKFMVPVGIFMSWNPSVGPPGCSSILAKVAYCISTCGTGTSTTPSVPLMTASGSLSSSELTTAPTLPPSASLSPSACKVVPPPGTPRPGTVKQCLKWYVVQSGDTCAKVAQKFGLSTDAFMLWNPSVITPDCSALQKGVPYCVVACNDSPSFTTSWPKPTVSIVAQPTGPSYKAYHGDGSVARGWPPMANWLSFDTLWKVNTANLINSCPGFNLPQNSMNEMACMKGEILSAANATGIDARFILAIILQESSGCVRVYSTFGSHLNPGLMQSHNGRGSCNNGTAGAPRDMKDPCPSSDIRQMILDGTSGTWADPDGGDGLKQIMANMNGTQDAQCYYRTARVYNSGFIGPNGNLDLGPNSTNSYCSDIANHLTGWVGGEHDWSLS